MPADSLIANRYRIERRIARGGQASVYLARQVPLNRKVALKILTPPPGSDAEEIDTFEQRFLLEAQTLATLDHPNIVTVYDYGQIEPGSFYIAMEFVEGRRFSALLREGPMVQQRALRLIGQVCSALSYAHRHKVIHRDIKNSNVLVRVDHHGHEQIKVVDFGIAKLMEDNTSLTLTGVVMGSPHFMAPEQARGAMIDHRVDIYAVGVLLYCGLVGRYPFNGTSSREIVSAHISQEIPTFQEANPSLLLHPSLEGAVRRCLAKEPSERFQDVDTLLTALTPFLSDTNSIIMPAHTTREANTTEEPPTKRPAWMGLLLAGAALIALLPALILAMLLVVLMSHVPDAPSEVAPTEIIPPEATAEILPEAGLPEATPPVLSTPEAPSQPPVNETPPTATTNTSTTKDPPQTTTASNPPPRTPVSTTPDRYDEGSDEGFKIEDNDLRDPWED